MTSSYARLPVVIEVTSTSTRTECSSPTSTVPPTSAKRARMVGETNDVRPEKATTARDGSMVQVPAGGATRQVGSPGSAGSGWVAVAVAVAMVAVLRSGGAPAAPASVTTVRRE